MAKKEPIDITLDMLRDAFNAGKSKEQNYRGQGKVEIIEAFNNSEEYLKSVKALKPNLAAEAKAKKEAEAAAKK